MLVTSLVYYWTIISAPLCVAVFAWFGVSQIEKQSDLSRNYWKNAKSWPYSVARQCNGFYHNIYKSDDAGYHEANRTLLRSRKFELCKNGGT